jgi:hypothetical protein
MSIYEWSIRMQNTNPKSELPAMKEKAAKDKNKEARQKSIDMERKGRAAVHGAKESVPPYKKK